MPYIKQEVRHELYTRSDRDAETPGELNFQITQLAMRYMHKFKPSYALGNTIVGVLECAKVEFCRRVLARYENAKCEENGDVYTNG